LTLGLAASGYPYFERESNQYTVLRRLSHPSDSHLELRGVHFIYQIQMGGILEVQSSYLRLNKHSDAVALNYENELAPHKDA
jgi:hypothetical protein